MKNRYVIILAAGKGSRMKSKLYKVLHPVAGKPMVEHVLSQTEQLNPKQVVTIVGHGAEDVMQVLGERSKFALQAEQLGTGHAVQQAENIIGMEEGTTLVICGDTPLLSAETLNALMTQHEQTNAKATILSATMPDPTGYGRIIRDTDGLVTKIVEQKDASELEKAVTEINTGTYCFDNLALFKMLKKVDNNNAQGEYYLPDVIELLKADGQIVSAHVMEDNTESLGVNDRVALAEAEQLMRTRINLKHMQNGVTLIDPLTTYIESNVEIGADTVIEPGVLLKGSTTIGSDCFIGAHSEIIDSELGDNVTIKASRLEQAVVHKGSDVGPYGRLRPNSEIGPDVHIGNFVEVKNAKLGAGTKAGHLAYIGDATLGKDINIGCGAIFVNYDGQNKFHSEIGDHVFIGSNSNIVAPVKIDDNSFVAAGSTINRNVPSDALAIARAKQVNKTDYAKKLAAFKK